MLPKALKICPKSNKSPNLVTLLPSCVMEREVIFKKENFIFTTEEGCEKGVGEFPQKKWKNLFQKEARAGLVATADLVTASEVVVMRTHFSIGFLDTFSQ